MAATFIFLSVLRTNTPSCIDLAMATLMSASMAEVKSGKIEKGCPKKELSQDDDDNTEKERAWMRQITLER